MDAMAEAFALSAGSTSSDAATTGQEALPSAAAASVPAAATAASTIGQDAMTSPTTLYRPRRRDRRRARSIGQSSADSPGPGKVRVKPRHHERTARRTVPADRFRTHTRSKAVASRRITESFLHPHSAWDGASALTS